MPINVDCKLCSPDTETKLHFEWPLMADDTLIGGKAISVFLGIKLKRVFYLAESGRLCVEKVTGILQLRKSLYHAWLFALAERGRWTFDEKAVVEMHLAVRKANALIQEMAERRVTVADLNADERACWADVMRDAVAATHRVLVMKGLSNGTTEFIRGAEQRLEMQN